MADEKEREEQKKDERKTIGKASATERDPNSSEKFSFWMAPDEIVNPFDIVEAEQVVDTCTYGLVTNIKQITDAPSHLSNYISSDFGSTESMPQTPRQGANIAEVNVLANYDPSETYPMGIYMPVQSESPIRFADEAGIHVALGIDKMFEYEEEHKEKITIPAGMIRMSNGTKVRVFLDKRYVLGPEGAHVNIAGISGLATKTSYAMFLIQSILQTVGSEDIAVILLNVKQNDLLVIDKPRSGMTSEDLEFWDSLGLKPQPFEREKVRYLLPWGKNTQTTGVPNCFGEPPDLFTTYAYSFSDVVGTGTKPGPGLGLLIRVPDPWDTMGALVGEIQQGVINNESKWRGVRTWEALLNDEPLMKQGVAQKLPQVQASSVGRFVRIMRRVVKNRQSGVFVQQRPNRAVNLGDEIRNIERGQALVVDIAKLTDEERALVFGHIIQEVYAMYAEATADERAELPKKIIIFVDELNKYAPERRGEGATSILEYVLDIAARGRSLGVVLISAEQFMSEVHSQVIGNCSTKVIGRSDSSELSDAAYRFIPQDVKAHLTRLNKGELLLSHPIYRQSVRIEFPKPAYQAIGHERSK